MASEFPDPSIINPIDFYSSAFRIKKLLRRRGWQDVEPMEGGIASFMLQKYYKKWQSFQKRKALIKNKNGGKEFERFVAQIIAQYYCNPATFSNKILDLSPGGDFDILVEGPGEALFYFETKTSVEETQKSTNIPGMWNFMIREAQLSADMSVFLYDSNHNLEELLIPTFEILYSLAKHLDSEIKKPSPVKIDSWMEKMEKLNFAKIHRKIGKTNIYYLYWPVVIIAGGDDIKKNVGDALSLYFGGIKYLSPFGAFRRPTREVFLSLPNWKKLPRGVKKETLRRNILKWAKEVYKKDSS